MKSFGLVKIIASSAIAIVVVAGGVSWGVAAAVSHTMALTQASVIAGATGKDGAPGLNGTPGLNGAPGLNGKDGTNGVNGARGPSSSGAIGAAGAAGTHGVDGAIGATGAAGVNATAQTVLRSTVASGSAVLAWNAATTTIATLALPRGTYAYHVDGSIVGTFTHGDNGLIYCYDPDYLTFVEGSAPSGFPITNVITSDGTKSLIVSCYGYDGSGNGRAGSDTVTWSGLSIVANQIG